MEDLPPPVELPPGAERLTPVIPPPGSPDALRHAGAAPAGPMPAAGAPAEPPPLVAALGFLGPMSQTVPLEHPFEWDGRTYEGVEVRRLIGQQVGAALIDGASSLYDFYALMTGLPAEVLRGLEAGDSERVTAVAHGFLPPSLRGA